MENISALFFMALVLFYAVTMVAGHRDDPEVGRRESEEIEGKTREREEAFLLQDSQHVVKTDAGIMRVVRGYGGTHVEHPMHIGFVTMEPRSLFIPHYLDCSLVLFIRRGEARLGMIYKDELVEKKLKMGDVYTIRAGSAFYIVNTHEGQRLHVICSIDTSESLRMGTVQSFFIGGGANPTSVLAGFDRQTLAAAFNVSTSDLWELMTQQQSGPIVHLSDHTYSPSKWTQFLHQKEHQRLAHLKRMVHKEEEEVMVQPTTWSLRSFLVSLLAREGKDEDSRPARYSPDSYNLYNRKPDFKNSYGWTLALDRSDYPPLADSDTGVYLVNLNAGSMLAPHMNPTAAEYGIVLRGSGRVQVVFPNGTSAMNAEVSEGEVFWVPRYFPFCQIASRSGPFEFFGFTTSAHNNRPQFLVGRNSVLQSMRGDEMAAAFGLSRESFGEFIDAQHEGVILPWASFASPETWPEKKVKNNVIVRD